MGIDVPLSDKPLNTNGSGAKPKPTNRNAKSELSGKQKDMVWEIREHTHELRKLTKELAGRVRSLRFFKVVRDLQRQPSEVYHSQRAK